MSAVAASVTEPGPATGTSTLGRTDVLIVAGAFLVSRVVLFAIGVLTLTLAPSDTPVRLADIFVQWDSYWYLGLARHGYSVASEGMPGATNYAFYPLYPALMWAVSAATGFSRELAGALISNLSFLAALFVLFIIAERWSGDRKVARLAVVLLCSVPEGFIFSAVYTEALFLLLTLAAALFYDRGQNFAAGVCAALSSATRSNGVLLAVYFASLLLRERGVRGSLTFWREPERTLPIVMAPLGLFAFWWLSMLTTGDAFAQKSTVVHGWGIGAAWPWNNLADHLLHGDPRDQFLTIASLAAFLASFTLARRATWPLLAYCLVNFLLYWSSTSSNSLLRYAVALFPLYIGLGLTFAHHRVARTTLIVCFAVFELLLMALWVRGSPYVL